MSSDIPLTDMFNISTRANVVFGIDGYEVPARYFDHLKVKQDKDYAAERKAGKPTKDRRYFTKKGCFLDVLLKSKKNVPGPAHKYDVSYKWDLDEAGKQKASKLPKDTKRNTFIDKILDKKTFKTPGPGQYITRKTNKMIDEEIKVLKTKKIKQGENVNYLCEHQFLSNVGPGPGQYNPHPIPMILKYEKNKPDDWIKKHKTKKDRAKTPDVGTYKPFPANYDTFGRTFMNEEARRKAKEKPTQVQFMGKDIRFKDVRKTNSAAKYPGAGTYPLIAQWMGKPEKGKEKQRMWMNGITKGISKSIYY